MDESQYHLDSKMVFEFIDQSGNSLWQFPQTSNAWDLLNAVQYQNSNVSDFYRDMFGK
jgi:2-C-methyl-D-erythritol 4-phosphate cytidylyltransferase